MPTYTQHINGYPFTMLHIQGDTFNMGDEYGDLAEHCQPVVKNVKVSNFYLAQVPVTNGLWKAVMGAYNTNARFRGDDRPVENVSWDEIKNDFLPKLNALDPRADGLAYRLPTEAQWEFAARGGMHKSPYKYAGSNRLKEVGWYNDNSHQETKPVQLKRPNAFDLYDMSGNVWEWCEDPWHNGNNGRNTNGDIPWTAYGNIFLCVVRGGSWYVNTDDCRMANSSGLNPNDRDFTIGFRLSRY